MEKTPLEIALSAIKNPPCKICEKSQRVNTVLYCGISGKVILPIFEDVQCCRGNYLKEGAE